MRTCAFEALWQMCMPRHGSMSYKSGALGPTQPMDREIASTRYHRSLVLCALTCGRWLVVIMQTRYKMVCLFPSHKVRGGCAPAGPPCASRIEYRRSVLKSEEGQRVLSLGRGLVCWRHGSWRMVVSGSNHQHGSIAAARALFLR